MTAEEVSTEQGFFHWDLEFGTVFAEGGFDLQVGNPPWVRPDWDEKAVLAEHDPWWQLASKPTQAERKAREAAALTDADQVNYMAQTAADISALRAVLSAPTVYPTVAGLRPDLYRSFMERTWRSCGGSGIVGLIHPGTHFTEKRATTLRRAAYGRLRRHWAFINKKKIFVDLTDKIEFGVHIYGEVRSAPQFVMATSLYSPDTVESSFSHNGRGEPPAQRTPDGEWDTRGHRERLIKVTEDTLATWARLLDDRGTPALEARMASPMNRASESVINKLTKAPKFHELALYYSSGWNETTDRKAGYFDVGVNRPESWRDAIIQGPHFGVATPITKEPRDVVRSNNDWDEVDIEALPHHFVPRVTYRPNVDSNYDQDYPRWGKGESRRSSRADYRLAWRRMATTSGYRTLYPTMLPPGAAHLFTLRSASTSNLDHATTLALVGAWSTLPYDFFLRVSGVVDLTESAMENMPGLPPRPFRKAFTDRAAQLICLTDAYADLWAGATGTAWTPSSPARVQANRRQLLVELDALSALSLSLSADELCAIYRTQFAVLQSYEQKDRYDANGRKVPDSVLKAYAKKGEDMTLEERQWTHPQSGVTYTYEFPFRQFDREQDMREAYARFEHELAEGGSAT